ncbi:hypothetical protein QJQ45_014178 [Haematococcus lacustris]|nr:hypothetical protein QJQ45_014178 [Haematococcus lacustris]
MLVGRMLSNAAVRFESTAIHKGCVRWACSHSPFLRQAMSFPDAAKRPRTDGFAAAQGMGGPYGQGMGGPMGGGPMAGEAGMMVQQGPFMGDQYGMGGAISGMFPCVKLRGLPFDVSDDDIRMFLPQLQRMQQLTRPHSWAFTGLTSGSAGPLLRCQGVEPIDMVLVKRDGRLTGEAFVVLSSPMQIEMALAKNRSYMGRRYIEIYKAKKLDYYKAICADLMDGGPMGGMNRWRGGEDGGLMAGYGRQPGGPYGVGPAGGPGGPAAGYSQALPSGAAFDAATGGSGGTTILKLRGLPFSVGDDDICQWFNEDKTLGIAPVVKDKCVGRGDGQGLWRAAGWCTQQALPIPCCLCSVLVVMDHGRPSGVAFVEFMSPAEATAAMAKNKQMMGSRYVEIFPATRADLDRCMQQA